MHRYPVSENTMASSSFVFDVSAAEFSTRVIDTSRQRLVLVDFWAAWCGPCKMLAPVLEGLAEEYQGDVLVAKVDADHQADLAARYGIRSLPTVMVFKNGEAVEEFCGALPEYEVRAYIERHLVREADRLHADAMETYRRGDIDAALSLLKQTAGAQPPRPEILMDLAAVYIDTGDYDAADRCLKSLPMELQVESRPTALRTLMVLARSADQAPADDVLLTRIEQAPDDCEARYQYAARRIVQHQHELGLEQLLEVLRRKPAFGDHAAQDAMVCVFTLLGNTGELVSRYRKRMFATLH